MAIDPDVQIIIDAMNIRITQIEGTPLEARVVSLENQQAIVEAILKEIAAAIAPLLVP